MICNILSIWHISYITFCLKADLQIQIPEPPKSTLLWHWLSCTVSTQYLSIPCNTIKEQLIWWIFSSVSVRRRYAYEIFKIPWYREVDEIEKTDWKWVRSRKRDFIHLIEKKSKFVMKNRLLKSETEFCIDKNLQICF